MNKTVLATLLAVTAPAWVQAEVVTLQIEGTISTKQTFFDGWDPSTFPDLTDADRAAVNGIMSNLAVGQSFKTTVTVNDALAVALPEVSNFIYEVVSRDRLTANDTIVDPSTVSPRLLSSLGPIGENDVLVKATLPVPIQHSANFYEADYTLNVAIPDAGIDFTFSQKLGQNNATILTNSTGFVRQVDPDTSRAVIVDKGGSTLSLNLPSYQYGIGRHPAPELTQTIFGFMGWFAMPTGQLYAENNLGTLLSQFNYAPATDGRITVHDAACSMYPFNGTKECGYVELSISSVLVSSVVPEPSTFVLMGLGLVGMAGLSRRRAQT